MASGGFRNPSIFPENRLFCIFKRKFSKIFKIFENFWKIFENFFEKNFFQKFFFVKKIFLERKFWKIFLKIVDFLLKYWFFLWKSSIFPIFEAPSAPRKCPRGGFGAPKKALLVFKAPFGRGPPTTSLVYFHDPEKSFQPGLLSRISFF